VWDRLFQSVVSYRLLADPSCSARVRWVALASALVLGTVMAPFASARTPATRPLYRSSASSVRALPMASTSANRGRVYFTSYPGEGSAVESLRVRPKVLQMSGDASWIIDRVRWSGWGGVTAHGSGVSAVETCNPTCAGGGVVSTPSRITLSRRRRLDGHLVYECIDVVSRGAHSIATEVANAKECLAATAFTGPDPDRWTAPIT
jgi:hypothetical protein